MWAIGCCSFTSHGQTGGVYSSTSCVLNSIHQVSFGLDSSFAYDGGWQISIIIPKEDIFSRHTKAFWYHRHSQRFSFYNKSGGRMCRPPLCCPLQPLFPLEANVLAEKAQKLVFPLQPGGNLRRVPGPNLRDPQIWADDRALVGGQPGVDDLIQGGLHICCWQVCRCGGTGRRPGLKIPWEEIPVPVRPRSSAPNDLELCSKSFFVEKI